MIKVLDITTEDLNLLIFINKKDFKRKVIERYSKNQIGFLKYLSFPQLNNIILWITSKELERSKDF